MGEQVIGLAVDPVRKTYWIYTNLSLFELVTGDENRDVWSIYLSQGQHEVALRHAKVNNTLNCLQVHILISHHHCYRQRLKETESFPHKPMHTSSQPNISSQLSAMHSALRALRKSF